MKAVFDTNILIDYLRGLEEARRELGLHDSLLISPISWMEVVAGVSGSREEQRTRRFLQRFELVPIDREVSEAAVIIRRQENLRLPDAIIWASARVRSALLVTRNTKDFPDQVPEIRVPYTV